MIGDLARAATQRLLRRSFSPGRVPSDARDQAVLASVDEWKRARAEARSLGLPVHPDPPKSWDTLLAISAVLRHVPLGARIVDAGGELYSAVLPSLQLYGYRDLHAINPVFTRPRQRAGIHYLPGDATRTDWQTASVGAITCLSVVEHGVDVDALLRESARLLQPGGILVISTDYWPHPMDTRGVVAYGVPVRIFDRAELASWVPRAAEYGLAPTSPVGDALTVVPAERPVLWRRFGLRYTFALLTFQRTGR